MVTKEKVLLEGIDTVIIRVNDILTAKEWYYNKLGLSPRLEDPQMNLVVLYTYGPTSLTLWQADQPVRVKKDCILPYI